MLLIYICSGSIFYLSVCYNAVLYFCLGYDTKITWSGLGEHPALNSLPVLVTAKMVGSNVQFCHWLEMVRFLM